MSTPDTALSAPKPPIALGLQLKFSVGAIAAFTPSGDINARITHQTSAMEGHANPSKGAAVTRTRLPKRKDSAGASVDWTTRDEY